MNLFKGLVTHVIDPSNFWMRFGTESDMKVFDEYQRRLDAFYNEDKSKCTCHVDQMFPGYYVVVCEKPKTDDIDYCDKCHWERAQVTRVDMSNKSADVFFVDLGYTSIVSVDDCRDIPVELFNFLAPQASRVSLSGIKPLAKSWTSRASGFLQKLVFVQDIVTLLVRYDNGSGSYDVIIYTKLSNGLWQSLIHQMQHKELALGTDEIIEDFLSEETVKECLQRMENVEHSKEDSEISKGQPAGNFDNGGDELEMWDDGEEACETEMTETVITESETEVLEKAVPDCQQGLPHHQHGVTGFDYRALMQTRSVSITKMQHEKDSVIQQQTKAKIEAGLRRMDSDPSHHDDQDWDAVQDVDFHDVITSQIYHGAYEQPCNDNGLIQLLKESHRLDYLPKKLETDDVVRSVKVASVDKKPVEQIVVPKSDCITMTEMESYELEKEIKQILHNKEGLETDLICASVYSIVEPDLDAPLNLLKVVICAILEHVMENVSDNSGVAFAIMETYSDARAFVEAMVAVITDLKTRYVRKPQSVRFNGQHEQFGLVLASVFQQAEEWDNRVCRAVQDHVVSVVERWILFNKQRKMSGKEFDDSEIMYLEIATMFLSQCNQLVKTKFENEFRKMMSEIREKLLHDGTSSWIRARLLDLLLNLHTGQPLLTKPTVDTSSVATQTDRLSEDSHSSQTLSNSDSVSHHDPTDAVTTSLPNRKEFPKSIRNLPPPRFIKKYLQENVPQSPPLPLSHKSTLATPCLPPSESERAGTNSISESFPVVFQSKLFPCQSSATELSSSETHTKTNIPESNENLATEQEDICCEEISVSPVPCLTFPPSIDTVIHSKEENRDDVNDHDLSIAKSVMCSSDNSATPPVCIANSTPILTVKTETSKIETDEGSDAISDKTNSEVDEDEDTLPAEKISFIRYTPQQLRDLDPFKGQPKLELWDLWEPQEVLKKMIVMVYPGKSCVKDNYKPKSLSPVPKTSLDPAVRAFSPSSRPLKEDTCVDIDAQGSSVDPEQTRECPTNDNEEYFVDDINETFSDSVHSQSKNVFPDDSIHSDSLQNIAMDLLKKSEDSENDTEVWHDESLGPAGDFLKSQKKATLSRKAKKKQSRGRPLDEFLQEQATFKMMEESQGGYNDEHLFSPEALQMYEDLERYGVGQEVGVEELVGTQVTTPSKLGSNGPSSSKRPSLISSVRSQQSSEPPKPWCPGKRFCSRCGSSDHVVYDCPEKMSRLLL